MPKSISVSAPLIALLAALLLIPSSNAQTAPSTSYPNYPSETPAKFKPVTASFDYVRAR